jgi:hypothetical protein
MAADRAAALAGVTRESIDSCVRYDPGERGLPGVIAGPRCAGSPAREADGLSRERRVERTPPIDMQRNASAAASVTTRFGPAQQEGRKTLESGGPQRRSCATGGWHNSMALWPSWPPPVRSAGPLPHSRRTWCILGDPARSGQPRMRTKVPSHGRRVWPAPVRASRSPVDPIAHRHV